MRSDEYLSGVMVSVKEYNVWTIRHYNGDLDGSTDVWRVYTFFCVCVLNFVASLYCTSRFRSRPTSVNVDDKSTLTENECSVKEHAYLEECIVFYSQSKRPQWVCVSFPAVILSYSYSYIMQCSGLNLAADTHLQLWSASPEGESLRVDHSLSFDRDMLRSCECFHLSLCHSAPHFHPSLYPSRSILFFVVVHSAFSPCLSASSPVVPRAKSTT